MKISSLLSKAKKLFTRRRSDKKGLGDAGEKLAEKYLKSLGFKIIRKNYSSPFGEIDIIAREKDTLVFVEVKSRNEGLEGSAEYAVDSKKRYRITRTALYYLNENKLGEIDCRFDVVIVHFPERGRARVSLIKNAFPI